MSSEQERKPGLDLDLRGRSSPLRRLSMVRAGLTGSGSEDEVLRGTTSTPLSAEGRRQVELMTHFWEWAEVVVSSPIRRAWETASILAGEAPVAIDDDLRARDLGPWSGRSGEELAADAPEAWARWSEGEPSVELPGAEPAAAHAERIVRFLERALVEPYASVMLVSHRSVIRSIAATLVGPLPAGRPHPAEMVLLTRQEEGVWGFGRRTSDPPPLRSPLENTGLSGWPDERPREGHQAPLELAGGSAW